MALTHKLSSSQTDPSGPGRACLDRTRTAVLNVLVGVGLIIAVSGGLLRYRADRDQPHASDGLHQELMAGLFVTGVISYATRRIMSQRMLRGKTVVSESLFYWSHLLPAVIAALAAPLGLVHGWWVDASMQSVIPFWVVALALGFLTLPRASELECFDRPAAGSGSVSP